MALGPALLWEVMIIDVYNTRLTSMCKYNSHCGDNTAHKPRIQKLPLLKICLPLPYPHQMFKNSNCSMSNSLITFNIYHTTPPLLFLTLVNLPARLKRRLSLSLPTVVVAAAVVVVVFHLWHLKMSMECAAPKTYDNFAGDCLALI